jgi:flagellar biosynthesis/type III secretory pathway M-ring protein FliF/YscJ
MKSDDIAILAIAFLVAAAVLFRPVFRAWARRMDAETVSADTMREVAELRERFAELDGTQSRLQELEERVDFAERLLAQRNDAMPLPRTPA